MSLFSFRSEMHFERTFNDFGEKFTKERSTFWREVFLEKKGARAKTPSSPMLLYPILNVLILFSQLGSILR